MVNRYLVSIARQLTYDAASEFRTLTSWEKVKEQRRLELLDMLGLEPLPLRTPLNARITGVIDKPEYTIEKLAFESQPKIFATANLYLPKKRSSVVPAVIYVCGHAVSPQGSKVMYQHHAITFAKHGYACLIIDPIQIAETFALHHGVHNLEMPDWYARGYTPAGVEVWNVIRALDYLETRPEVDKSRFGITGRSGGAAMSWFSAAVDLRLKVAVPVMGNSTYAANVAANTQKGHCDCMFPINTYQHDLMTQGALIAPRPLHMMHGKQDALFPIAGYEEFEAKIGRLYGAYEAGEKFKNTVVDTAHKDSDFLREQALRWFDRYLMQVPNRPIDLTTDTETPERLAVFAGSPPPQALNFRVHELLTANPSPDVPKSAAGWAARRQALLEKLNNRVFRAFPTNLPKPEAPTLGSESAGFREWTLVSEPGVRVRGLLRSPAGRGSSRLPTVVYIASEGEDEESIRRTLMQVLNDEKLLLIMFPRGVDEVPWRRTVQRDVLRNAMHLGRSLDSMRLWDVMRSVAALKQQPNADPQRITLLGRGISGVLGLYAAIFDESVAQVVLLEPPVSHRQGPIFLNILRYTDLPEAAALLAPRRLIFFGRIPNGYQATQAVYRLLNKPENISLTMSLKAVVDQRYDHNFSSGY
ncbi:MAG TPA: acetylxylan esterase [Terriglobia bacterium]|nr:acetylxylan esterase [Terriglobia bacterium]